MFHDKTRSFTEFDLSPNSERDAVPMLQQALDSCRADPGSMLIVPPGRYDLFPEQAERIRYGMSNTEPVQPRIVAMALRGHQDFTLRAEGARFVYHGRMMPMVIDGCENVRLEGFTLDAAVPSVCQAHIDAVTSETLDVTIQENADVRLEAGQLVRHGEGWSRAIWGHQIVDAAGAVVYNTADNPLGTLNAEDLGAGRFRLHTHPSENIRAGHFLLLRSGWRDSAGIFIFRSRNVTLDGITIHFANGCGILGQHSENITLTRSQVVPAPGRKFSTWADATHWSGLKGQLTIEDCRFKGHLDDAANVHGTSTVVREILSSRQLLGAFKHWESVDLLWAEPGDTISFLDRRTLQPLTTAQVGAFVRRDAETFVLEFAADLPADVVADLAMENLTWNPDFTFRRNEVRRHRARGLLVSTPGATVIEENIFSSPGAAIVIAGDANGWFESGAVRDVLIRNNQFDNCNTSGYGSGGGVIHIDPVIPALNRDLPCYHRNIRIEGNRFRAFDAPYIAACSVDGLTVRDNSFSRTRTFPPRIGSPFGLVFDACRNVIVEGNRFRGAALGRRFDLQRMESSEARIRGWEPNRTGDRFTLEADGSILWDVRHDSRLPHTDRIEISGLRSSLVVQYGADANGFLILSRHLVWPMLRTIPNNTHASLQHTFGRESTPQIMVEGVPQQERLLSVRHRGLLELTTVTSAGLEVTRQLFASRTLPAAIEQVVVANRTEKRLQIGLRPQNWKTATEASLGVSGAYILEAKVVQGPTVAELGPGERTVFGIVYRAYQEGETPGTADTVRELREREAYVAHLQSTLILETPDPVQNRMFAFAKIRAAESIFATSGGLMHGPGGTSYYAAIWANDQAEYANPYFAYLGDANADESALNSYRHFARFMNPDYRPIPSSIIAEGLDIWHGAGDRGDMAMIAYGAARYALTRGDRTVAEELWPLIVWCLEYLRRQTGPDGVLASDSDELEGRFPHGRYNLNTSSLAYDALLSASYLARDLGRPDGEVYAERARALHAAIEAFFGATMSGFETYRYYEGNTTLRAWICTPLCMGIYDRAEGTLDALLSPYLWTPDGIRSEAGSHTFWDRATLYAMRGLLAAGAQDRVLPYLVAYSRRRLLGDHVPYAIEAWPEGDQRHLSAESALYGRVFVEGLFGFRPTGLRTFTLKPNLPSKWRRAALRQVHACGRVFDIEVVRKGSKIDVKVADEAVIVTSREEGAFAIRVRQ